MRGRAHTSWAMPQRCAPFAGLPAYWTLVLAALPIPRAARIEAMVEVE